MSTEGSNAEVRRLIEAAVQQFVAAFNHGDAAAIAQLYAQDGQILPPQSEPIAGRPGVQAFWQGAMDMGVKAAKLQPGRDRGTRRHGHRSR